MKITRGDILLMDLENPPSGAGREKAGFRPNIVVSLGESDSGNLMITIIPMMSVLESQRVSFCFAVMPTEQNGLSYQSVV